MANNYKKVTENITWKDTANNDEKVTEKKQPENTQRIITRRLQKKTTWKQTANNYEKVRENITWKDTANDYEKVTEKHQLKIDSEKLREGYRKKHLKIDNE